ncbi:MAG: rRNA adenine N-6-methyltransferase family protein, partial [bacterium]|nr:rRNA adenine N-6-methyltransferase family protein [bacterium]
MRLKKSLGQNFLRSNAVAKKLVDSGDIMTNDVVVEVGPGKGIITNFLLQKAGHVIAIEKDGRMIEYLKEKFSQEISSQKLTLVYGDILKFYPNDYELAPSAYIVVG